MKRNEKHIHQRPSNTNTNIISSSICSDTERELLALRGLERVMGWDAINIALTENMQRKAVNVEFYE